MTDMRNELDLKLQELKFTTLSRTVIHSALDELGLLDREDETKLELREGPGSGTTLIATNPDGSVKHVEIGSRAWTEGKPRPTEPGVYQDPKKPTSIYTLYNDGSWRSNQNFNGAISPRYVPENLTKIA